MNDNNIIAYAFMSALLSGQADIYTYVYLPLAMRAVSAEAAGGKTSITKDDFVYTMGQMYGLNIPDRIASRLMKMVYKKASRKQKSNSGLVYDEKGTLTFSNYNYSDKENLYDLERRNTEKLQHEFDEYMARYHKDVQEYASFSEFIDRNKKSLSSFFSGKRDASVKAEDTSFLPHVQYLKQIECYDHTLFNTARHIYLGTLMATFLEDEIDVNAKLQNNTKFYLDTQIVLEALDLQDPDKTKSTRDLLKLIRQTGAQIRILDITLEEIANIIRTSVSNFSSDGSDYVVDACKRRGKKVTWLNSLLSDLENRIKNELQITVDQCGVAEREKILKSDEYKKLSSKWKIKNRAKHDAIAFLHVRALRPKNITSVMKAACWFVTNNEELYTFNIEERPDTGLPEVATPGFLTGILFLANPSKSANSVSHIMLSESIAQVMLEESPNIEIIREFEEVVKSLDIITPDEYGSLRDALALKSKRVLREYLSDTTIMPEVTKQMVDASKNRIAENENLRVQILKARLTEKSLYSVLLVAFCVIIILLYYILFKTTTCGYVIISAIFIIALLLIWFWRWVITFWKWIVGFILSSGGLWGFFNFVLNLNKNIDNCKSIGKLIDFIKSAFGS